MGIDPTARVEDGAVLGADVSIGPFCLVGPHVTLGDDCKLVSHVHISGHTRIGAGTVIYPFASLGTPPQSTSYQGGATRLVIGANCTIRESVTMNTGTEEGSGLTEVGDRGFFMSYSHVGHDCRVGNDVVFANSATLGGHCTVGDQVFMGGLSAAHQFTCIGAHAMISGVTGLRGDVIPFAMAAGAFARLAGVNVVGMRRRKFSAPTIRAVRSAYRLLFLKEGELASRVDSVEAEYGSDPAVSEIIAFVRADRKRPLCYPGTHHDG
ncbi:MAG: UDP-N-acetylglucosamine acyltransferase [Variibacter sp.]|jgi:UDP-N-acetylglucosamine acyltransferase|nr:UDP-N-acetylglucosamine acyltransferase [Variibacter sp.]